MTVAKKGLVFIADFSEPRLCRDIDSGPVMLMQYKYIAVYVLLYASRYKYVVFFLNHESLEIKKNNVISIVFICSMHCFSFLKLHSKVNIVNILD